MKLFTALSCAVLAAFAATSLPARADLRPPPIEFQRPKTPAAATFWLMASVNVMKSNDPALADKLCDPRGYHDNLVGGSGNPLASLFAQGGRKGWHLTDIGTAKLLPGGKGAIVHASVRDNTSNASLDEVWLLLIKTTDADGAARWLALGAGEELAQVDALATRFVRGLPLAPPPARPEAPVPE